MLAEAQTGWAHWHRQSHGHNDDVLAQRSCIVVVHNDDVQAVVINDVLLVVLDDV